ncbi:hypothetical protein [Sphingobium fuliginis]|uniref:hypothetical protein n=1 Tax=Sphingobium fuliginis (strain ATCC 27551) TaxID=336203 RepID=UPI001ABF8DCA|nr:hypothetical protein [Sphingobium fuliginis]
MESSADLENTTKQKLGAVEPMQSDRNLLQSDFQAIGTDRRSRITEKQGIWNGDPIQFQSSPLKNRSHGKVGKAVPRPRPRQALIPVPE